MEIICKGCTIDSVFSSGFVKLICCPICTPMKSRTEGLWTTSRCLRITYIASAFHNIDFSTGWPSTILEITRHEPNGRPKPVPFWKFSPNLNSTKGKGKGVNSCKFATHYWIDVINPIWFLPAAIVERRSTKISRRSTPKIIVRVISYCIGSNFLVKRHGLDKQYGVVCVSSGSIVLVNLKFVISTSCEGEVVSPFLEIKFIEVIVEDQFGYELV